MSSKLKVMTFNLRVEAPAHDGINDLPNRKGRILEAINTEAPDLIGFQEVEDGTRAWLRDILTDYVVVGCGGLVGYRGASTPLAFKKDRFEMVSMEAFWLSSTPNIPGSIYEGSDQAVFCPRVAIATVLKPIDSSELLLYINTHADHKGAVARSMAVAQLIEYSSKKGLNTLITGDFNARPECPEIKMMTANSNFPLTDATINVGGTFHGFGQRHPNAEDPKDRPSKIDYIFTNLPTDPSESYAVEDVPVNGIYISDHLPVVAFVEV